MMAEMDERMLGKEAFEGYAADMDGKTFDGRDIPAWDELGEQVQSAWIAAARKVIAMRVDYGPQRWHGEAPTAP